MKEILIENLNQLTGMLQKIPVNSYRESMGILFGSSISQHVRHVLEFYLILVDSSSSDVISYDKRKRDKSIEESPLHALSAIERVKMELDNLDENETIIFEADFSQSGEKEHKVTSSVLREMAYCIEHSIHHQALIKSGLVALNLIHIVDENFGVAYSTIRYNSKLCAQ